MGVSAKCARIIRAGVRAKHTTAKINNDLKKKLGVTVQASTITAFRTDPKDRTDAQKNSVKIRKG